MQERIGFVDLLLLAEETLGEPAERLHREVSLWRIESALAAPFLNDGGFDAYPDPVERAAICCSRLIRNRPFPRGNEVIAFKAMREMLERAGLSWSPPPGSAAEIADQLKALAKGTLSEEKFVDWVRLVVLR